MEDMGTGQEEANNTRTTEAREYRRGNWTLPETMVLIEAKKRMHDDREPAENLARWKWVEDYCWRGGCRRSQNQCNDRWDNLMRDYKKVRAYEHGPGRSGGGGGEGGGHYPSYWAMGRVERKERGLPTNLLREIYEAMGEVVERKMSCGGGGVFVGASSSLVDVPMQASPLAQVLPRALEHETHGAMHGSHDSPEKKRRRPSGDHNQPGSSTPSAPRCDQEEHHHGDGDDDGEDSEDELSSAIGRCAAILSEAMETSDAAEERRHREVMSMEQRRSRARQARREASEQCMAGLAAAMNRLASSMLALHQAAAAAKRRPTTDKRGPTGPK